MKRRRQSLSKNKTFFIAATIILLFSFSNIVYATSNLLSNPGFESGSGTSGDNWTQSTTYRESWANHTGSYGMATHSWDNGGVGNAYQTVSATAGTEYTFSTAVIADAASYSAYMKLTWLKSDDTEISSNSHSITTTLSWVQETLTATAPANTAKVKVEFGSDTGGTTIKFDDATLMAVGANTYVWDGGGADTNFSTRENWVSNFAPGSGDSVLFDNTSNNCTLDGPNLGDGDFEVTSGYSGAFSSSGDITVDAADLDLTNATWSITNDFTTGGGNDTGALTITAGTFTTSNALWASGNITLSGNASINQTGEWTVVEGQTTKTISNSGTGSITFYKLEEHSDTSTSSTYQTTINCDVTVTTDVIVNNASGGQTGDGKLILTGGKTLDIGGKFENKGSFTSDNASNVVQVAGDIDLDDTLTWGFSDSGTFEWDGTGTASILTGSSYNHINNLTVSGTGTLYFSSASSGAPYVDGNFSLSNGTFIVDYPGSTIIGTTTINSGTMKFYKNATLTGAVTNSSTMELHGQWDSVVVTIGASINNTGGAITITDTTYSVNLIGSAGALRPLTGNNIDFNTHNINLNNIDVQVATTLDESGDQITLTGDCTFDALTVSNAGASVDTNAYNLTMSGNLDLSADSSSFSNTAGTLIFAEGGSISVNGNSNSLGNVKVSGNATSVTLTSSATIGTLDIDDDGDVGDVGGTTFTINSSSGAVTLTTDSITIDANSSFALNSDAAGETITVTLSDGSSITNNGIFTLTSDTDTLTLQGTDGGSTEVFTGNDIDYNTNSITFLDLDYDPDVSLDEAGDTIVLGDSDCVFDAISIGVGGVASTFNAGANNFELSGNFTSNAAGTFTTSGIATFSGTTGTQTITSGGKTFSGLTINNTGTSVQIQDAIDVNGNFHLQAGTFDCNAQNQNFAGNFQLDAATTYTKGGTLTFDGTTTFTDSATQNIGSLTVAGSVTQATNLSADSLTINDTKSLTTAGYNIDLSGALTISGSGSLVASDGAGGSSNIQIGTNLNIADTASFTAGGSTLTFDGATDNCTIDTGASIFNNVTISKTNSTDTVTVQNDTLDINGNLTITEGEFVLQTNSSFGDNAADTVSVQAGGTLTSTTAGITITFFADSTTTLADDSTAKFIFTGAVGNLINLHSSTAGTQWNITRGNNAYTIGTDYIDVKDSNASSGATMSAGTNSTDSLNNTNWVFDGTKIWVGGGTDTNFTTADNWQNDTAPTTGDSVLFSYGSNNVDLDHFDMGDGDFEMTSGYSGTVGFSAAYPGRFMADKVTLDLTNATWNITDEFRSGQGNDTGALTITAGTFTTSDVLYFSGNITLSGTGSINQTGQYTEMNGTAAKTISNSGTGSITFYQLGEISDTSADANASTTINCDVAVTGNVEVNDWDAAGDGKLILTGGKTLDVGGDFINKGSFTSDNASNVVQVAGNIDLDDTNTWAFSDSGTFEWDGTGTYAVYSGTYSTFNNFTVSGTGTLYLTSSGSSGAATISGNYSQSNGTVIVDYPGLTISGTTSVTGGTMKFFKDATLTGNVTNSSTMQLNRGWASATLTIGSGATLDNTGGTFQIIDTQSANNTVTLTGNAGQFIFTGNDIDYNAESVTLKYIDYDPDVTLATGETIVIGDANCEFDGITINSGGTLDDSGGYNFNLSGNWTNSGTFTQGTSTVIFNGTSQSISGTTTFYGLTKSVTTAATLTFEASQTQTVSNSLTLNGASGQLLSLRSSTPGTQAALTLETGGNQSLSYLDVKDNNASGGDTLAAGPTSTNSGNNNNWTFKIISVTLRNAGDTADYTTWAIGSGKTVNTVYLMDTGNCVLVKNNGNVAEDFSLEGVGTNWTLDSSNAVADHCVLMGLFNGASAPAAGDFSTTNDLITGTTVWATYVADGSGKFQGASDGDNVGVDAGEKLYIYLKTPSSITSGNEETITVTVGSREH